MENEGWIEWGGGKCPVEPDTLVEYRMRPCYDYPDKVEREPAGHLRWEHTRSGTDIVAYRVVNPAKQQKPWYPDDSGEWVDVPAGKRPDGLARNAKVRVLTHRRAVSKINPPDRIHDADGIHWASIAAYRLVADISATDLLDKAAGHMRDRAATYDKPEGERSMAQTVKVFNAYHGTNLTETQGWHFMQVLKDVRLFQRAGGYHADSAEDGIAYAALKAEAMAKEAQQ